MRSVPYVCAVGFKSAARTDYWTRLFPSVYLDTSAAMVNFEAGKTYKFKCPPGGKESSVWGTDIYTVDSSICNAAVHAGKLTSESGGSVTIELRPGESSYKGSTRNGIKTNDYGKYGQSFAVK